MGIDTQAKLATLGAGLPALPGVPAPRELRHLAYFNSVMTCGCLILGPIGPIYLLLWYAFFEGEALRMASPLLSRQVALGKSGQYVMRTMLNHAVSPQTQEGSQGPDVAASEHSPSDSKRVSARPGASMLARLLTNKDRRHLAQDRKSAKRLRNGLPWLPAFDRRDALAVRQTLDKMLGRGTALHEMRALAFSAYTSATLVPSPGDAIEGRSLRAWLAEKNMESVLGDTACGGTSSWLDAKPPSDTSGPLLHFSALAKLGWNAQRGATCLLTTPAGFLCAPQPEGWEWDASRLRPVRSLREEADARLLIGNAAQMGIVAPLLVYAGILTALIRWDPAAFRWGACGFLAANLLGVAGHLLPLALITPIEFSRQLGAAPHMFDFHRKCMPLGYSLNGLLILNIQQGLLYSVVAILFVWGVASFEGWPDFEFPMGSFRPGDLSHGTEELLLVYLCVVFVILWHILNVSLSASMVFHMWHRAGHNGAVYALRGMDDMRYAHFS